MGSFNVLEWVGVRRTATSEIDGTIGWRALIAEYLGTLLLVLLGTLLALAPVNADPIAGPFAGGLALASIIQAVGHVSGGHVNPAMSMGFFAARRMSLIKALLYSLAQCAGAISGSAILKAITPSTRHSASAMGSTLLNADVWPSQGFAIEICITFVLVFMTISATDPRRSDVSGSIPLAIGIYVVAAGLAAGPFTGASMNPARSLGPAVISGTWTDHWVYWCGPILGGLLAGVVHYTLFDGRYFDSSDEFEVSGGGAGGADERRGAGGDDEEKRIGRGNYKQNDPQEKGSKY